MAHKPSWQPTTGKMGVRQFWQWVAGSQKHSMKSIWNVKDTTTQIQVFPTGSTSIWLKMCWPSTQNLRIQNEGTWGRSHFWQRERPTIGGLFEWFNRYSQHQHHSTIKHLAIFRNISRDSKTKSDTYHHHSEKLWSSGDQFHPWTFKLLPWWPQVAICGSLSTFFLEHTSKHGTKNCTCCFNSVEKSRHDFIFKSIVYIPLLYM